MTGDTRPDAPPPARGPEVAVSVPVPDATRQDAPAAPERSGERTGAAPAGYACTCAHDGWYDYRCACCNRRPQPSSADWQGRAEQAEAKVAEIESLCRGIKASVVHDATPIVAVDRILAITEAGEARPPAAPRQRPGDQPPPIPNDGPSMHDLACDDIREGWPDHPSAKVAIADLQARKKLGLERYGSLLQARNGRDALRDLYEELQDGLVYAKQAEAERDADGLRSSVPRVAGQHLAYWLLAVRELMGEAGKGEDGG